MSEVKKVFVIGTGYVGLTTGLSLAYLGFEVICMDIDKAKIKKLSQGQSPIHEPHINTLLRDTKHMTFTNDIALAAGADVIMICVGTPSGENGHTDLSFVEAAASSVGAVLEPNRQYVVVNKSTVPVGTAQRVKSLIRAALEDRGIETKVHVASNPEFLREGEALYDMFYPDRIVVGVQHESASHTLWQLYRPLLEQSFEPPSGLPRPESFPPPTFVVVDTASSEMIKYAANAFLATKISFINEIAGLCERVGADVREVSRGIGLDKRIGSGFLKAGIGWGGSCFGKDTASLVKTAEEYHYGMPLLTATRSVNFDQRMWIIAKLQETLKTLRGRTIGVLGLAFKPNTDDVRDAPSVDIIQQLVDRGAHVRAHDPQATENARKVLADTELEFADDVEQVFDHADAVVLLTEWKAYRNLPFGNLKDCMRRPLLIDGRNVLDENALTQLGYHYVGVGLPCE